MFIITHFIEVPLSTIQYRPEASISTRILGPDPTTFEAHMVHPIVDPTKFREGVGDARILCALICIHDTYVVVRRTPYAV